MDIEEIISLDCNESFLLNEELETNYKIFIIDHKINRFKKNVTSKRKGCFIYLSEERRKKIRMKSGQTPSQLKKFLGDIQQCIGLLITEQPIEEFKHSIPQLIVHNTWEIYKKIAELHRSAFQNPVIAITGSVGKSTTRLLTCALIESQNKQVLTNDKFGSNVRTIIPQLLTELSNQDAAVLEVAINALTNFDSGPITPIISPYISIITQVGGAHLADLQNTSDPLLELAKRKGNIFKGMTPGGIAILNADMDFRIFKFLRNKATELGLFVLTYSLDNKLADAFVYQKEFSRNHTIVYTSILDEEIKLKLNMPTDGVISDLLAALLVYKKMRLPSNNLFNVLENFKSLDDELELFEIHNNGDLYTMVDDTHGSTILSAINTTSFFTQKGPFYKGSKVLIMETGEDLGTDAENLNLSLLPYIMNSNIDLFIGYGDAPIKSLVAGLQAQNFDALWVPKLDDLFPILEQQPDDSIIFVKSRDGRKEKYKSDLWTFPKLVKKKYYTPDNKQI